MALGLRACRNLSPLCKTKELTISFSRNAGDGVRERDVFGIRGVQGKQAYGSSLPLRFLFCSSARSSHNCVDYQVSFLFPHSSSLCIIQKRLPLILPPLSPSKCRQFCKDSDSMISDSEDETDDSFVVYNSKSEIDDGEVDLICKVIDETFAVDRNMEAVLDEIRVNLSHDLVLAVLERYKQAQNPAFRFFSWASSRPGFFHDAVTYNAMMSILGKARQFETMLSLLGEMGDKGLLTIETFIICIKVFAAAKERRKAVGMIDLMRKYYFKVDVEVINCLLEAVGRDKLGKEAYVLFEKLEEKFSPNLRTCTVLLSGLCRVKNLMVAGKIWNEMIDCGFKGDTVAYNVMLKGLIRGKKLFEIMKSKGPQPDVRSYTIVVLDLCKRCLMDEAVAYFDEMIDRGFDPDAAIYTCLMTGFGKQNKMDAVYSILEEMKAGKCHQMNKHTLP